MLLKYSLLIIFVKEPYTLNLLIQDSSEEFFQNLKEIKLNFLFFLLMMKNMNRLVKIIFSTLTFPIIQR